MRAFEQPHFAQMTQTCGGFNGVTGGLERFVTHLPSGQLQRCQYQQQNGGGGVLAGQQGAASKGIGQEQNRGQGHVPAGNGFELVIDFRRGEDGEQRQ